MTEVFASLAVSMSEGRTRANTRPATHTAKSSAASSYLWLSVRCDAADEVPKLVLVGIRRGKRYRRRVARLGEQGEGFGSRRGTVFKGAFRADDAEPAGQRLNRRYGPGSFVGGDTGLVFGGDVSELAYLSIGTGIAAGIVLEGHLHRGRREVAGEIGYFPVDPRGPKVRVRASAMSGNRRL